MSVLWLYKDVDVRLITKHRCIFVISWTTAATVERYWEMAECSLNSIRGHADADLQEGSVTSQNKSLFLSA